MTRSIAPVVVLLLLLWSAVPVLAAEPAKVPTLSELQAQVDAKAADAKLMADTLWVMVTGMLVFFMNLGFGCVESGMCRAKNAVNILSKNFIVFGVTSVGFLLVGFGLMFGGGNDYIGLEGLWLLGGADNSPATGDAYQGAYGALNWTGVPLYAKFFFQLVFAGTAATIVSGAVAERIKYHSFIIFSFIMAIAIYPVIGHWIWGGGLLSAGKFFGEGKAMMDFAGSTVVHSVGGWAALAGVLVLGPRIGKYGPDGKPLAIPGHSMLAATIGCLILWFGWFGFNPGSTMAADPNAIARVALTTNTAAAFATLTATLTAWIILGKPDIGMTLNGSLAGLVAITAPCAFVSVESSIIIGSIAGVLVVLAVIGFDRIKCDDPVGATSVHLVNGVFGTIAVGLFGQKELVQSGVTVTTGLPNNGFFFGGGMDQLWPQLAGVGITAAYIFPVSLAAWLILKYTVGIRVTREEEVEGLDIGEHGNEAYPGFVYALEPITATAEPRSAIVPPNGVKRFSVVVEGTNNGEITHAWSKLCQAGQEPSPEFKAVYPYMTMMSGNRFLFRGGDPQVLSDKLAKVLQDSLRGHNIKTRVE